MKFQLAIADDVAVILVGLSVDELGWPENEHKPEAVSIKSAEVVEIITSGGGNICGIPQ